MSAVTLWRYSLPSVRHEGWATIVLGSDGYFSTVSDYGNYAYRWTHHGYNDFRQFFLHVEPDYFVGKIAPERRYSGERTHRRIAEEILRWRREGLLDRETARREYALLGRSGVQHGGVVEFGEWMKESTLARHGDAYELGVYVRPTQAVAYAERILPRLRTILRAELYPEETAHA
jgi:hypothetical protein